MTNRRRLSFELRVLWDARLGRVLTPAVLFELGNIATTMLILRATDLLHTGSASGRSITAATSLAILLYAAHNAVAAISSAFAGRLVDRRSARLVLGGGAAVYVAGYLVFAVDQHAWFVLLLGFVLAGVGIGLAETAESTSVALHLPDRLRAQGFGVLGLMQSLGDLGATVTFGVVWVLVSPTVAFLYAATWMVLAVVASTRPAPAPFVSDGS